MREFAGEYGRDVWQENVRSKAKELNGTLPYAHSSLSMCPTTITASLEESEVITTACQVVDAKYGCTDANQLPERRHIGSKTQM